MDGEERVLTVMNYVLDEEDEDSKNGGKVIAKRVTIAPHMVHFIIASEETHAIVDGRELLKVNVIMSEGVNLELSISMLDLNSVERAIGTYFLPS